MLNIGRLAWIPGTAPAYCFPVLQASRTTDLPNVPFGDASDAELDKVVFYIIYKHSGNCGRGTKRRDGATTSHLIRPRITRINISCSLSLSLPLEFEISLYQMSHYRIERARRVYAVANSPLKFGFRKISVYACDFPEYNF